jgi:hypothetical protein
MWSGTSCDRVSTRLPPSEHHAGALGSSGPAGFHCSVARRGDVLVALWRVVLGAAIPFTLIVILPTNKLLMSPALDKRSAQAGQLLARWGALHAVRSVLSTVAFLLFLYLLLSRTADPAQLQLKYQRELRSEVHGLLPSPAVKFNFEKRFCAYPVRQNAALDNSLRRSGTQRHGARQSKTRDLAYANRMLDETLFAINLPHKAQVDPHRLLNSGFGNIHDERLGQVGRSIFPCRERWFCDPWIGGTETDTKGRSTPMPT